MARLPPDKFMTLKCKIDKILLNKEDNAVLFDACTRANKLVINTYQFIRLYLLYKYDKKETIKPFSKNVIKQILNALTIKNNCGPKTKGKNKEAKDEFLKFYDTTFNKLNNNEKINGTHLSHIIDFLSVDIITNIENNIKLHYKEYINKFVNSLFKKINNDIIESTEEKLRKEKRKELRKELFLIKNDIFNNTLLSPIKYHKWIELHRNNIIYKNINLDTDLESHPQKYLNCMIYMCKEIEKCDTKSFQFLPQRNNIYPKHFPIDTAVLLDLFNYENKKKLTNSIVENYDLIWNKIFDLSKILLDKKKNPSYKNYQFNYTITTNCFDVSLTFINKKYVEAKYKKIVNNKASISKNNLIRKNMNQEEKNNFNNNIETLENNKKIDRIIKTNEYKKNKKKEFASKSKEEKNKILRNLNGIKYIDDLNIEEINELKRSKWVVVDPGKNTLLHMKSKTGHVYRYTNKNHLFITKRLKYQRLLQNHKNRRKISKIENQLTDYNSKTCNYEKYKDFIKKKNEINKLLFKEYESTIFRKYKWYSFLNKKKSDKILVEKIKTEFGKNAIICLGDWSRRSQMRGITSTPNLRIKKLLKTHFKVYDLDEYNTSKLNCYTKQENKNLYLPDKNNIYRELHSVLTYQMENNRLGCINRDSNAVNNMIEIVKHLIHNKYEPQENKRPYEFKYQKEELKTEHLIIKKINNKKQATPRSSVLHSFEY